MHTDHDMPSLRMWTQTGRANGTDFAAWLAKTTCPEDGRSGLLERGLSLEVRVS
jgi:hypothetical protein